MSAASSELPAAERGSRIYFAVAFVAGAIIALQIAIMRIFAVGNLTHFGSLVVSLAMLGFGLASVVICLAEGWFERHWRGVAGTSLILFGPLIVFATLAAQTVPFNAIFIVSDPNQKWLLLANFGLYLLPFFAGAMFLGVVFVKMRPVFGRVYFADLTGSGLAGLVILAAMYLVPPEFLLAVPLLLWWTGGFIWMRNPPRLLGTSLVTLLAVLTAIAYVMGPQHLGTPRLAVSSYKGVSYVRNFPDAKRILRDISPFGDLEIYRSSYLHFAPGLSDNAAFNVPDVPTNAYLGMYIDGDGPSGIMRPLPARYLGYFRYLPMHYPYVVKREPDTFVVQLGGGISTRVALSGNSKSVTVAEGNPAVLAALRALPDDGGDILTNPRVHVVASDGRLYLATTRNRYDVIDLSLADSVGLSNPGGFAIVERYAYTREAMLGYMRALKDGGVLSVTLWNKEEPPKSILKLYATMADAARTLDAPGLARSFYVVSNYLSTTTVLYKKGGFTADEIARLRAYTKSLSFDDVYYPGLVFDSKSASSTLNDYRASIFGSASSANSQDADPPRDVTPVLPTTILGRLAWHALTSGGWDEFSRDYVFDTSALTNDRPYFAGYVKPADLPRTLDRLELFQDDWGYLLLWATLAVACLTGASLITLPLLFAWRGAFARYPGKFGAFVYFACLGLAYIMVEVGFISRFTLALTNPTISASILISGLLVFSGLGSLASEKLLNYAKFVLPLILVSIAALLYYYAFRLGPVLDIVGSYSYPVRLLCCFGLIAPPAFLMGFPMPTAMAWLARLGKTHVFVWAWGINGCFSVIGAALVPLVATTFGLAAVLLVAGAAYVLAIPAFFRLLLPVRNAA